jgi:hypothetical protein
MCECILVCERMKKEKKINIMNEKNNIMASKPIMAMVPKK